MRSPKCLRSWRTFLISSRALRRPHRFRFSKPGPILIYVDEVGLQSISVTASIYDRGGGMSQGTYPSALHSNTEPAVEERLEQASLRMEADWCRSHAKAFEGKPEKVLLLRLASEFERLSLLSPDQRRPSQDWNGRSTLQEGRTPSCCGWR